LGVNATSSRSGVFLTTAGTCFNGHPPLGVNATSVVRCVSSSVRRGFNGHPPLGVNATMWPGQTISLPTPLSFNGHPPLGVNATSRPAELNPDPSAGRFQRAPTLGGECYPRYAWRCNRTRTSMTCVSRAPTLGGECYPP